MWTHLSPPLWIVSTWSLRRWKWPLWWTLCRTVSPRSPSARSVCSSHQPSHSCICHRHTPQPRQESISTAFFFFKAHLSWSSTGGAVCCVLSCTGGSAVLRPQVWFFKSSLVVLGAFLLLQPVDSPPLVKDASVCVVWGCSADFVFPLLLLFLVSGHRLL